MLPQIGYVVAQAGADASSPQTSIPKQPLAHLTSSFIHYSQSSNDAPPHYYGQPSSNSPPHLLPPLYFQKESRPLAPQAPQAPQSLPLPPPPPPPPEPTAFRQFQPPWQPWQDSKNTKHGYRESPPIWYTPQPYLDPSSPLITQVPASSSSAFTVPSNGQRTLWQDKNEDKVKIKVEEVDEEEDEEEEIPAILEETEILHRLREYNELITWMDSEFQNQSQDLFHKKLERMQHEMLDIQQGSHPAYLDEVSDLKLKREKTIFSAECFMAYQLEFAEGQHAQSMNTIQDEFEMERRHLHTTLMTIIDDRRKQIKEDKLEDKSFNIEDVFQDAHSRISHRRNLRNNKKPQGDKLHGLSSRHEPTRRRQARVVTLHNIHAQPFSKEEEELKADFISMKIR